MTAPEQTRFAFIGFGEAGQAIAAGLRGEGVQHIAAWDILFAQAEGSSLKRAAEKIGARVASSAADAVREAEIVMSAVTATSSFAAAQSAQPHLAGQFYLDVNSVSPGRKRETAKLLDGAARYVDVAIVSAIHPARHKSPMLLAGPHAQAVAPVLNGLGMHVSVAGHETGAAAAIKMVRSVMIKGIEALTLECFLAAARAGVVDQVAASLKNNYPTLDWDKLIDYNVERMASHGIRRAAEMDEVAGTLRELGIAPLMTEAAAARQREMGEIGQQPQVRTAAAEGRLAMLRAIGAAGKDRH